MVRAPDCGRLTGEPGEAEAFAGINSDRLMSFPRHTETLHMFARSPAGTSAASLIETIGSHCSGFS